ncbi:unnamed protein product [Closterium sp. Naga37s-1]|nr:unnamed protein product [Closterium sp. Naga37s-1]
MMQKHMFGCGASLLPLPPAPPPSSSAAARPPVRSVIVFISSCQSCQAVSALLDEVGLSNAPLHALLPQCKRSAALHRFKASQHSASPSFLPVPPPPWFRSCQAVSALLDEVGLSNAPLHALLPQRKRSAALHRFKASQVPILVATDVASRGLDIPTVDLVINYDIPSRVDLVNNDTPRFTRGYVHKVHTGLCAQGGTNGQSREGMFTRDNVHRVGRTARAGRGCVRHLKKDLTPLTPTLSHLSPHQPRFTRDYVHRVGRTARAGRGCVRCLKKLLTPLTPTLFTRDYVHRVGRTARAGRGGRAISLVTQYDVHLYDVHLVHSIEKLIGRQLAECTDVTEGDVLKCISKVFKARRAALLKVSESGFEERAKQRAEQKRKIREERREREEGEKGKKGK